MPALGPRPTPRGGVLLAAGAVLCLAAWVMREPVLLWPGGFLLLLPIASLAALLLPRPSLAVARWADPTEVAAGGLLSLGLELTGTRPAAPWTLTVSEPLPPSFGGDHRFSLAPPGTSRSVRAAHECRPARRGRFTLEPVTYEFSDPLALAFRRLRVGAALDVAVTPPVLPLGATSPEASGGIEEAPLPMLATGGPADVLVREYRSGDEVRRIHWPSTARTGALMVRREEQTRDPVARLLLDTRAEAAGPDAGGRDRFEWLVSLAASVGVALLDAGYRIDSVDADGTHYDPERAGHADPAADWVRHLIDASPSPRSDLALPLAALDQGEDGQLVVAVLARLTLPDAEEVALLRAGRHRCWALFMPGPHVGDDEQEARAVLEEAGFLLARAPVSRDPAPAWAALAAGAKRSGR